jgi:hypothetical protein
MVIAIALLGQLATLAESFFHPFNETVKRGACSGSVKARVGC